MILTADLHLQEKTLAIVAQVFKKLYATCEEVGDLHVGILGDLIMVRHVIPVILMEFYREQFEEALERKIKLDILVGNHDMTTTGGRNALDVFRQYPNVRVHSEPTWTRDGLWVPYIGDPSGGIDPEGVMAALSTPAPKNTPKAARNRAFMHLPAKGGWMNNQKQSTDGMTIDEMSRAGFTEIWMGHYHRPHEVAPGVEFVGSPYQVSYTEAGQSKRLVHLGPDGATDIPIDVGPKHHHIIIDADDVESGFTIPEVGEDDLLWVTVRGKDAGMAEHMVKSVLEKAGIQAARIEADYRPVAQEARIEMKPGVNLLELIPGFLDAQDLEPHHREALLARFEEVTR